MPTAAVIARMRFNEQPFWVGDAAVSRDDLTPKVIRRDYQRLHRGVYFSPHATLTPADRIRAALMRAGPGAVVAGESAAIIHGVQYFDEDEVELIRGPGGQGRRRNHVRVVRTELDDGDVMQVGDFPVTTPIRTAFDLGRRTPDWRALARLDELAASTDLDLAALWRYIRDHPKTRGVRQIRDLIQYIDPESESPGESWLRLVMVRYGLPRPESQVTVLDPRGQKIACFDFGYRKYKVGIDFDGVDFHSSSEQRTHDARRDGGVARVGWNPLRIYGAGLIVDSDKECQRVMDALIARGYRP